MASSKIQSGVKAGVDWLWNAAKYMGKGLLFVLVLSLLVPLSPQQEGGILLFYLVWPGIYRAGVLTIFNIRWKKALHRPTPKILSQHLVAKGDKDKRNT